MFDRVRLGVNIDHVATIRQQRGTLYPDPVAAAALCELAGADQITVHLREDRRHIQDRDLEILRRTVQVPLNLEMAVTDEMLDLACAQRPDTVTLVPEKREEKTTEGGLQVAGNQAALQAAIARLSAAGIRVSLFVDPDLEQIRASAAAGARAVELHTGDYANAPRGEAREGQLGRLRRAAAVANDLGLEVIAGHGLDYENVRAVALLPQVVEVNIGHAIVARAILVGLERAVRDLLSLLER
jgi:pyridoxine 5-phosphate synthase